MIAARSPATTATITSTSSWTYGQREPEVVLPERARHERGQEDPERQAERRADQRRDHALVPDHPPRLPPRHPDRAQHPQLAGALEDRQRERVHHAEEADDHRQREQHVEQQQELLDLLSSFSIHSGRVWMRVSGKPSSAFSTLGFAASAAPATLRSVNRLRGRS